VALDLSPSNLPRVADISRAAVSSSWMKRLSAASSPRDNSHRLSLVSPVAIQTTSRNRVQLSLSAGDPKYAGRSSLSS